MHPGQMFLDEILNISNTHLLGQWCHVNNLLSFFKKNAVRISFAVKVIFVSWILSDIVKIPIGERCKFWLLHETPDCCS